MKCFLEFLNESSFEFAIQVGYESEMIDDISDGFSEYNIKFTKTKNKPIDPRDQLDQYIVSGKKKDVIDFLKDYGFEKEYYTNPKFIVSNNIKKSSTSNKKNIKPNKWDNNLVNDLISKFKKILI